MISVETSELGIFARERMHSSGVAWGAVVGGAFVAAALSLIMLALGAGFGLSAVSPWSNVGASASAAGAAAIMWLILSEVIASSMGGYLAGRLRTSWHPVHGDEVHFRDTANGFLAWAVALVITVAFLASAAASMVGNAGAGDMAASNRVSSQSSGAPETTNLGNAYFVDSLFRSERPVADIDAAVRAEAGRILTHQLIPNDNAAADAAYLGQLVTAKTGINSSDAAKRVSNTIAAERQMEDRLRSATAHLLLWIFLALLIGAFCASYAATIGGRQRDHIQAV